MLDHVLVKGIGRQLRLWRIKDQLRSWHKPEQIALAATVRAIALNDRAELTLNLE
jgi:hypothetical protein